jgi:hypothetical protein
VTEYNDTKLCWTDADLAETELSGYGRGFQAALKLLTEAVNEWQRPTSLNFRQEVLRLIAATKEQANQ